MSIALINPSNHMPGRKPKSAKALVKQQISVCNVCRFGVYDGDDYAFYRQPVTGICHTACVDGRPS